MRGWDGSNKTYLGITLFCFGFLRVHTSRCKALKLLLVNPILPVISIVSQSSFIVIRSTIKPTYSFLSTFVQSWSYEASESLNPPSNLYITITYTMPLRGSSPEPSAAILRSRFLHDLLYSIEDAIEYLYKCEAHIYTLYARSSEQIDRAREILSEVEAIPPSQRHNCADIIDRARMLKEETRDNMRRLAIELGDILIEKRALELVVCYLKDACELD